MTAAENDFGATAAAPVELLDAQLEQHVHVAADD